MNTKLCGRTFGGRMAASPFERIVAFGYEDGPVSGIVRCTECEDSYRFEVMATDIDGIHDVGSWGRGEELRVFALAPLPEGTFDHVVTLLAAVAVPSWPIWVPGAKATSRLDQLLPIDVAATVHWVDRWQHAVITSGLLQSFVAVRDVPPVKDPAALDWFALFGYVAKERQLTTS